MATWGEFIKEIAVSRQPGGSMVVPVDQVIDLWEERNQLRAKLDQLEQALLEAREACAREVEEFAEACAAESDADGTGAILAALRAAATLIREQDEP